MKTIQSIQSEIKIIVDKISDNQKLEEKKRFNSKKIKSLNKKIAELRNIIKYLETNPSLDYLTKERDRISGILQSKETYYNEWLDSYEARKLDRNKQKSYYNKLFNLSHYKELLKTVNYILK